MAETLKKVIVGVVVQEFNPETEKWVNQEFVGSDNVCYEDDNGLPLEDEVREKVEKEYLAPEMVQPKTASCGFGHKGITQITKCSNCDEEVFIPNYFDIENLRELSQNPKLTMDNIKKLLETDDSYIANKISEMMKKWLFDNKLGK